MAYTWGADDILTMVGLPSGLNVQESAVTKTTQNAVILDENGNSLTCSNEAFDVKQERTISVKMDCNVDNPLEDIEIGGIGVDGLVLTSLGVIRVNNDYPTLNITAHSHPALSDNDHMASQEGDNKFTITSLDIGFGIPSAIICDDVDIIQSQNQTWTVQHVDRLNNEGDHLIGNSFGIRQDITEVAVDNSTISYSFSANGVIEDSINNRTVNVNFKEVTYTGHKFSV